MERTVIIAAVLLIAARADAQAVGDSLIVNLKNGQRVAIPLSSIQKITFDSSSSDVVQINPNLPGLQVSPSFPNPSRSGINIEFSIPGPGSVGISIFDSKGNLIRLLPMQNCTAGQNQIRWDGLDDRGSPIPSGAYFYEVQYNGETQTKQMVVIK
jgi:hypothetical protein